MAAVRRYLGQTYSVEAEVAFVALVLLAWHAIRIPIEGDVSTSVAHARDVLHLESALSLDVERRIIEVVAAANAEAPLRWLYANIHLPVLFGFVVAARLLSPARYPFVRTTFALSFVPAALIIALFPLAPPHWLPELGLGGPPSDAALTNTTGALFHNTTAAAVSQHFGFTVLIAATTIWLFPRSRLAWLTLAYPALAFVVVVGTGNHYVVDCIVGTLMLAGGAAIASRLHREPAQETTAAPQPSGIVSISLGYALVTWGFVSLDLTALGRDSLPDALVLAAGLAAIIVPRLGQAGPLTESS
jgi:PAP2 superfamily protein